MTKLKEELTDKQPQGGSKSKKEPQNARGMKWFITMGEIPRGTYV